MWLRVRCRLPELWPPEQTELAVDLGFDDRTPGFQVDGLGCDSSGAVIKGIAPRNSNLPLKLPGLSGDELLVYVEAAANPSIMGAAESLAVLASCGRRQRSQAVSRQRSQAVSQSSTMGASGGPAPSQACKAPIRGPGFFLDLGNERLLVNRMPTKAEGKPATTSSIALRKTWP